MSALWFTTPSSRRFPEDGLSVAIRGCGSENRLISTKFSHSS
jgi:hypothetical protein